MKKSVLVLAAILPFCSVAFSSEAKTLKGVTAIEVVTEDPGRDAFGLTKERLKTDVEMRLKTAGISVGRELLPAAHPGEDWPKGWMNTSAMLSVRVSVKKTGELKLFVLDIQVFQPVKLLRDTNVLAGSAPTYSASTWQTGMYGFTASERSLSDTVADQIDEFIHDYLSVNPK